ncbi:hypothetical protein V6N12_001615, partial [Hibiscus sabdariffa]
MQVVHRRRKISPLAKDATGTRSTTCQGIQISGSRFTALQQVDDEIVSEGIAQYGCLARGKAVAVEKAKTAKEIPFAPKTAESSWHGAIRVEEVVIPVKSTLDQSKHQAVKVVDKGVNRTFRENNDRIFPVSIRGGSPVEFVSAMRTELNRASKTRDTTGVVHQNELTEGTNQVQWRD